MTKSSLCNMNFQKRCIVKHPNEQPESPQRDNPITFAKNVTHPQKNDNHSHNSDKYMTPSTPGEYQESQSQFIKLIISRHIFTWFCQMWRPGLDQLCRLTTTDHIRFCCVDKDHREGRRTVCGKKQLIAAVENGPAGVFTDTQGSTICADIHPRIAKAALHKLHGK